jgi:hypothetical protein
MRMALKNGFIGKTICSFRSSCKSYNDHMAKQPRCFAAPQSGCSEKQEFFISLRFVE